MVQPKKEDKNNNKDNLAQIKKINIPYFDYSSDALNQPGLHLPGFPICLQQNNLVRYIFRKYW